MRELFFVMPFKGKNRQYEYMNINITTMLISFGKGGYNKCLLANY